MHPPPLTECRSICESEKKEEGSALLFFTLFKHSGVPPGTPECFYRSPSSSCWDTASRLLRQIWSTPKKAHICRRASAA